MSQFSIPLQPVAQPTNQFVAPRLRQPDGTTASQLSQLGSALSQVVPEISQIIQGRQQASNENAQKQANADFLQKRYENSKALKAAVDRGEIAQSDNPYYMVQLHQDVAANEAAEKVRQMNVDWETSPVRFSDDPSEVQKWAQQQLAPVTDGRDVYESEAIAPVVQQGVSGLVGRHMEVRRAEREDERVANFQQRVSSVLAGPDPKAASDQLQVLMDNARLTMPGAQVNALTIKAASDTAEASGDDSVLGVLGSIKNTGAGGTLADAPEVKRLQQQLPLMRLRRSMEIDSALAQQQKQAEEKNKQTLLQNLMQASGYRPEKVQITPGLAAKWGIPFQDMVDVNEQATRYGQLQDEQGDKAAERVDKSNKRLANQIQGTAEAGLASGKLKLTDPEVADAATRIAVLDPDAANQFNRYLSDRHDMDGWQSRVFARDSDPVVYGSLWDKAKDGSLTTAELIPQAQKLSHDDWTRLFQETVKPDTGAKLTSFPMAKYDDLMKDMIVFPKSLEFSGVPNAMELAAKDGETDGRVLRAQTKFAETVHGLLNNPQFANLARDEQTTRIRKVLDSTAEEFGGVPDAKRQKFVEDRTAKQEQAQAQAAAKMNNGVSFKDGVGTLPDGTTFGTPTSLSDEVRGQVRSVASALASTGGAAPRSLDQLYAGKTTRSWWQALTMQPANDFRNRDELVLSAFVHNAHLLHAGSLSPNPSWRLVDAPDGPHTVPDSYFDVQTSAQVNFQRQREELAGVRRRLGETWVTEGRRDELKRLTTEISGLQATGQAVPADKASRFSDLAENFRLYDFLGVTAGVDRQDIQDDYHVLYKYPAASSLDEFNRMGPFLTQHVPVSEFKAVQAAQRSLIANAQDLLVNRRYVP